jgi:hypothetical protein
LGHFSPIATKKLFEKEHLSSDSSRRLRFPMAAAAESSRRLQLMVRQWIELFPARIPLRMAFDGANSCNSGRPNPSV